MLQVVRSTVDVSTVVSLAQSGEPVWFVPAKSVVPSTSVQGETEAIELLTG